MALLSARPSLGPLAALPFCPFFSPRNLRTDIMAEIDLANLNGVEMEIVRRQVSMLVVGAVSTAGLRECI